MITTIRKTISKLLILYFGFIFVINSLNAQTVIDYSEVSGTWTKNNSPYLIYNDITISDGTTLTIEPGVKIEFRGYYKLDVKGRLLAIGNVNDNAPNIEDSVFSLAENSPNGYIIGSITANDGDGGIDSLEYSIISGNSGDAFRVNAETGEISVNDSSALDFESSPTFNLGIETTDGLFSSLAEINIRLIDVVETQIHQLSKDEIYVYPNPVYDKLFFNIKNSKILSINIYNITGEKIISLTSSKINSEIDFSELNQGIYIINMETSLGKKIFKIMKQ